MVQFTNIKVCYYRIYVDITFSHNIAQAQRS